MTTSPATASDATAWSGSTSAVSTGSTQRVPACGRSSCRRREGVAAGAQAVDDGERPRRCGGLRRGPWQRVDDVRRTHRRLDRRVTCRVDDVDAREGDVIGVVGERRRRFPARGLDRQRRLGRARSQPSQRLEPPRADHLRRRFDAGREDALDGAAIVVQDRSIHESDIDLFARAVSRDEEQGVLRPRGSSRCPYAFEHRSDHVPAIGPRLAAGAAEEARMAGLPQQEAVRVVVQDREVGSPPQHDRHARRETDADRCAEGLWPCFWRPQRRRRPIQGPQTTRELAVAGEDALSACRRGRAHRGLKSYARRGIGASRRSRPLIWNHRPSGRGGAP